MRGGSIIGVLALWRRRGSSARSSSSVSTAGEDARRRSPPAPARRRSTSRCHARRYRGLVRRDGARGGAARAGRRPAAQRLRARGVPSAHPPDRPRRRLHCTASPRCATAGRCAPRATPTGSCRRSWAAPGARARSSAPPRSAPPPAPGDRRSAEHYNCVHGMGHGFMEVFSSRVFASLRGCEALRDRWEQDECSGGVFMENVTAIDNRERPARSLRSDAAAVSLHGRGAALLGAVLRLAGHVRAVCQRQRLRDGVRAVRRHRPRGRGGRAIAGWAATRCSRASSSPRGRRAGRRSGGCAPWAPTARAAGVHRGRRAQHVPRLRRRRRPGARAVRVDARAPAQRGGLPARRGEDAAGGRSSRRRRADEPARAHRAGGAGGLRGDRRPRAWRCSRAATATRRPRSRRAAARRRSTSRATSAARCRSPAAPGPRRRCATSPREMEDNGYLRAACHQLTHRIGRATGAERRDHGVPGRRPGLRRGLLPRRHRGGHDEARRRAPRSRGRRRSAPRCASAAGARPTRPTASTAWATASWASCGAASAPR